jgi:hypothetical protein
VSFCTARSQILKFLRLSLHAFLVKIVQDTVLELLEAVVQKLPDKCRERVPRSGGGVPVAARTGRIIDLLSSDRKSMLISIIAVHLPFNPMMRCY